MKPFSSPVPPFRRCHRPVRQMPAIDCSFQASPFGFYGGHCAGTPAPSFYNISRDYFRNEARYHFIGEAAVFVAMILTSALAIGIGAAAAFNFLHLLGYF
jgi:hypothetical protein